jgi:hypothetical protein
LTSMSLPDSVSRTATADLGSRRVIVDAWLLLGAGALTVSYPNFLNWWHSSYSAHGLTATALAWLLCAYLVPVAGFSLALALGQSSQPTARTVLLRRLALFIVVTPPAFTLLGVLLYLMRISDADAVAWRGLCALVASGAILRFVTLDPATPAVAANDLKRLGRLRYSHGVVATVLFVGFIAWHLLNHLVALEGSAAHTSLMHILRHVYRNSWVEPTLLVLMAFQLLSGLTLWRAKTLARADVLTTLQTASGVYLAVYLASHVNSVFVLARHAGIETDWAWATGAPVGILRDVWNIRLLPHYSLAVFLVLAHISCGFRGILIAHRITAARADLVTWILIAISATVALAISVTLVGGRLP